MTRYAILLGSAPEDFIQKKLEDISDFLNSKNGRRGVVTFANGITEQMLEMVLDNSMKQNPDSILLYLCTLQPVGDDENSLWLGGEEIKCDVISHYQTLAAECGIDMQVIFDSDRELVSEEELGWEEVFSTGSTTTEKNLRLSAESAGDFFGGTR